MSKHKYSTSVPNDWLDAGLNPFEISVLFHFAHIGTVVEKIKDTARACRMSMGQVSKTIAALGKKGYLPKKKIVPGVVYVLRADNGAYKIGMSTNPHGRFVNLTTALPFRVSVVLTINSKNPSRLERDLHARFKTARLNGEWFALQPEDIAFIRTIKGEAL